MQELANVLGRERVQLEFLLFKTLELQHLLRAGDTRYLRWAAEEIVRASQHVRTTELTRARRITELAFALGTDGIAPHQVELADLAERTREPWRTIFADHSMSFRLLVAELDDVIEMTTALADARGHAVAEVLRDMYRPARVLSGSSQFAAPRSMVLP
jgi:hypothetical protein